MLLSLSLKILTFDLFEPVSLISGRHLRCALLCTGFRSKKFLHAAQDSEYKQGIHDLHEMQKLADQVCRYDLDDLDVSWLGRFNELREEMGAY